MKLSALKRGWSAFDKSVTLQGKAFLAGIALSILWIAGVILYTIVVDAYAAYRANHASPAEMLQMARGLCSPAPNNSVACPEDQMDIALQQLEKIPPNAPEHAEATKLGSTIQASRAKVVAARQKRDEEVAAFLVKRQAEHDQLTHQSQKESREQMWKNILGQAHDPFRCGNSAADNSPIISFDYGHYWWSDDGRCAAQLQKDREAAEKVAQQKHWEEQRAHDSAAELYSYWSTTIRVDTDMDSFWLVNEERTCQTYPDDKGKVSIVYCNASGSHKDHNIPVKFWGGVDRNTVSDWKCRREKDEFVCRAID